MADGGGCSVCGYAMVLKKGDVWRCSSCWRGVDGSPKPSWDVERVVRALEEAIACFDPECGPDDDVHRGAVTDATLRRWRAALIATPPNCGITAERIDGPGMLYECGCEVTPHRITHCEFSRPATPPAAPGPGR